MCAVTNLFWISYRKYLRSKSFCKVSSLTSLVSEKCNKLVKKVLSLCSPVLPLFFIYLLVLQIPVISSGPVILMFSWNKKFGSLETYITSGTLELLLVTVFEQLLWLLFKFYVYFHSILWPRLPCFKYVLLWHTSGYVFGKTTHLGIIRVFFDTKTSSISVAGVSL